MGNIQSSSRGTRTDWHARGPLAPHLDAYKKYLTDRDYAASTFKTDARSVAHFAQWLHERHLSAGHIDESIVAEFLDGHPQSQCAGQIRRDRGNLSAALGHLLTILRAEGVISPPPASARPVDEELRRYDEYMNHVRGLAPKIRSLAVRIVGRLLISRFGDDAIDVAAITPDHVRRFFAEQAKLYSKPATAGTVVATLRGYFRYRASLGNVVHPLIGALAYQLCIQILTTLSC